MKSGISAQGAMTNQMFEVVHFSTQYFTAEDLGAMSAYLFDLDKLPERATPPAPPKPVAVSAEVAASARASYIAVCASCHGGEGQGIPHVVVPLGDQCLAAAGRCAQPQQGHPDRHPGPALPRAGADAADAGLRRASSPTEQVADLSNWLRANWGGQQPSVTAEEVKRLR
jgi:mono/diheme cytochrome c family protein